MSHVFKYGKGWCYRITKTVNGKRTYKRITGFPTQEAAEAAYLAEVGRKRINDVDISAYTLEQWLEYWYENYAALRVAETTLEKYKYSLKLIVTEVGHIQIGSLKHQHIQSMISKWAKNHKPPTVRVNFEPLRASLNDAVKLGFITYNPCAAVTLPRSKHAPKETLTQKQAVQLLDEARGKNYYIPILLALSTGMRRGEISALKWRDIDYENGFISVSMARVKKQDGNIIEKETKSDRSTRSIAIADDVMRELKEHQEKQPPGSEYVCTMNGSPMHPDYITRATSRLITRLGFPKMSIHGQRHAHATLMLAAGVHPKIVQERLGHSKITTTLDTYSHVLPSMQRESSQIVEGILFPKTDSK